MSTPAGGDLVGDAEIRVDADTDPAIRALQRFSRDTQGLLRDLRGRFASESRTINRQLANNPPTLDVDTGPATDAIEEFTRDTQERLRDVRGRFISESRAINRHLANNPPTLTPTVDTEPALQQIDELTRDAQGRLRDARGRFIRTGEDLGSSAGDGVTSGILATVRERVGGALQSAMSGLQGAARAVQTNPYVAGIGAALAAGVVASALPAIGALLGGAVIAVGGLSIIGIGAALLKDEPEVKNAATRLKDTVQGIFEEAAQPLKAPFVEALKGLEQTAKDVAPQIEQAFRTVAESGAIKSLTDGFDQLVKNALPGFLKLIQDTGPVFEGIKQALADVGEGLNGFFEGIAGSGPEAKLAIEDLAKAIKFLLIAAGETVGFLAELYAHVRTTVTDVVGAFQWLYDQLIGNSIIPDLINGAVRLFASLPGRAFNALGTLTARVGERARAAGATLVAAVRTKVSEAVTLVRGLPGRASQALSGLAGVLRSRASAAGGQLVAAVRQRIADAVSLIRGLPGRARSALANLGSLLYSSGRSLVQGFVDGIRSKIGDVASAVGGLVAKARGLFPGSPAKEGPFSGRGWVLYSGQAISEALAEGMAQREQLVRRAASMVATTAQTEVTAPVTGVSALPVARAAGSTVINVHLNFTNDGVIGSRIELENWLARTLDQIARTGRIPAALRTA